MTDELSHSQTWCLQELLDLFRGRHTGDIKLRLQEGGVQYMHGVAEWTKKPPPRNQSLTEDSGSA